MAITATMHEAKSSLSELVRKAQLGERVVITNGRDKLPVVEIIPIEPLKRRKLGLFALPGFKLPADFDEHDPEDQPLWERDAK